MSERLVTTQDEEGIILIRAFCLHAAAVRLSNMPVCTPTVPHSEPRSTIQRRADETMEMARLFEKEYLLEGLDNA